MPGKQDASLDNGHHLVAGASGSGKTTFLKRHSAIKRARRLVAWDPDEDHEGQRVRSRAAYAQAVGKAIASGKPFRLLLTVEATPGNFEWWCRLVWAIASADRPLVAIAEEISDVQQAGKASRYWGQLVRRGRKYGLQLFVVTQSPAECDTTIYKNTPYKFVGRLEGEHDIKRLAPRIRRTVDELEALRPGEYFYKRPELDQAEKKRLTFNRKT